MLSTFHGTAVPSTAGLIIHGLLYMTEGWIVWSEWNKAITATRES